LGTKIENLSEKKAAIEVLLPNGNRISSDFVIMGIGAKPNIRIAEEAGLLCNDGIIVNKNCITSDKNIFAIGDCSNQYNNYFGGNIRLESVDNAVNQAKIVAGFLTNSSIDYNHVPWFWTKQYNLNLQIAGFRKKKYESKIVGSMKNNKFAVYHISNSKLKAVEAVNNPKSFMRGKKLIQSQEHITDDLLI
jgi:3-phenylpropionate/trans-cinnamate dioxygenase ferredoxin reductase subunit